jgi:serine/threonine protein kinase
MNELSGTMLGPYQLLDIIGKGGMATVYRAHQASMGREVAIKIMSLDLADEPEFAMRFKHEAQIIARLQHPHIVPVYDFGTENRLTFLVMRLLTGGSLGDELRGGGLSTERVIELTRQIASALDYAHQRGVIHRDLKPTNVLLDEQGNAYLTDFGIAKMIGGSTITGVTSPGSVMGTPTYMAPEQWRSEPVDARTDVYALGVIVYQMLLGQVPFSSETPHGLMYQHLDSDPPSPRTIKPGLPLGIEPVIRKALAKNPNERYASAGDLARDLENALRFPVRIPEQTAFEAPVRPRAPDMDLERAEEDLLAHAGEDESGGRVSPATQPTLGVPPVAPPPVTQPRPQVSGTRPESPQLRRYTPAPASRHSTPPPAFQPSVPPMPGPSTPSVVAYTPPYRPPVEEPPRAHDYQRDEIGIGRFVWIMVIVVVAVAALAGVVLVIELLASSGGQKETVPTLAPPTSVSTSVPSGLQPSIAIQSPPNNVTVSLGDTVTIQFTATSPQGITRVELRRFNQVLNFIAVGNLASYQGTFLYQPDSTGVHIVEVVPWSGTLQGPPASVAIIVR